MYLLKTIVNIRDFDLKIHFKCQSKNMKFFAHAFILMQRSFYTKILSFIMVTS